MNREFLKKKKYLIILLALIMGIAANKFISAEDGPSIRDPLAVSVAKARVQDKPSMVPVTGSIEGLTSNIISSRFNGKVTNVLVEDGQYVQKGQVLFTIDMEELNDSLQMAESSLSQLQAKYEKAYADYMRSAKDTIKEADTSARYDGEPAIGIEVGKQSGANAVQVASSVKKEMEALQDKLPKGMKLNLVRDDAARISASIHEVWFDLLVGGVFAVVIVLWFLGDWQSTFISALAIPASIISTFLFMKLAGFSINTMSLLGLSIAFAMLVSLFVSFTLTPMMAAHYLPVGEAKMPGIIRTRWRAWQIWFVHMTNVYGDFLGKVLEKHKKRTLTVAGAILLSSLLLVPFLGSSFMPSTDQAQFTATVQSASSDSPKAIDEQTRHLTAEIKDIPEIDHIYVSTSNREQTYFIKLKPKKERSRSQKEVIAEVRSRWNNIPGVRADFVEDYEKPVAVSLTGENLDEMAPVAEEIQKFMENKPDLVDVSSTYKAGLPNLIVVPVVYTMIHSRTAK